MKLQGSQKRVDIFPSNKVWVKQDKKNHVPKKILEKRKDKSGSLFHIDLFVIIGIIVFALYLLPKSFLESLITAFNLLLFI